MKILVIDDSKLLRDRLIKILTNLYIQVVIYEADNIQDGYELFCSEKPEIIILDVALPGSSGITLLEKIKKRNSYAAVIMLTNYPSSQFKKICLELGADHFLDKTKDFKEVPTIIESYINNLRVK